MNLLWGIFLSTLAVYADQSQYILSHSESLPVRDKAPLQVAIIGGGAGGASAAYHLTRFAEASDAGLHLNITLYDTNARIGGRTTTVNVLDDPNYTVELGASIFVKINHILYNASQEFGLQSFSPRLSEDTGSNYDLGVWNGDKFVYKSAVAKGQWQEYWDIAKLLWQYGLAPFRTQSLMKSTVGKFLSFYDEPNFPFRSLQHRVTESGLMEFTHTTGQEIIRVGGISDEFAGDIIQASTRVNYAQNLDEIHGLGAMVCMATDGAMSIEGGNWQIFQEAVKRSKATVHVNTSVTDVLRDSEDRYHVITTTNTSSPPFDAIILAAPYQHANISFTPTLQHVPKPIPYVHLHVTLFTTPYRPSPLFFNLNANAETEIPNMILTTKPPKDSSSNTSDFFSINIVRTIPATDSLPRQHVYKIFSPTPISPTFLAKLFDFPTEIISTLGPSSPISSLPSSLISWSHTHLWHSYPYLLPTNDFSPVQLDDPIYVKVPISVPPEKRRSGGGVWYTSGIEPFISTMETSALMGMNVARLIVDEMKMDMDMTW